MISDVGGGLHTKEVLDLLEIVTSNPRISQRDLAARLGVSLGKINFLLRALIEKGLITAQNFKNSQHKRVYLYQLTPNGLEEKTRMTYRFLKRKMREYEEIKVEIEKLQERLADSEAQHHAPHE